MLNQENCGVPLCSKKINEYGVKLFRYDLYVGINEYDDLNYLCKFGNKWCSMNSILLNRRIIKLFLFVSKVKIRFY